MWLQRPTLKTYAKFINSLRPYCCWERKLTPLLVKIITNFNKRLVATVDPAQQPLRLGRLIHNRAGRGSGSGSGFIRHKRSSQEPRMDSIVACSCSEVFLPWWSYKLHQPADFFLPSLKYEDYIGTQSIFNLHRVDFLVQKDRPGWQHPERLTRAHIVEASSSVGSLS